MIIETTATARLSHNKSKLLDRAGLARLATPLPMGPQHRPIPHIELVDTITAAVTSRGFAIEREQFSAMRDGGSFLFGTMLLRGNDTGLVVPGAGLALGFRSGNRQEKPIEFIAGNVVFVCDNLCLRGDFIVMKRKHTSGLDLVSEINGGFDRFLTESGRLVTNVEQWQNREVSDGGARDFIFRGAIDEKAFPVTRLPDIWDVWSDPTNAADPRPECEPRTLWGLHNSVTRVLRDGSGGLGTKLEQTAALARWANKWGNISLN